MKLIKTKDALVYSNANVIIDMERFEIIYSRSNHPEFLTAKEWMILRMLIKNPGKVVSDEKLFAAISAPNTPYSTAALRAHTCRLKRKLPKGIIVRYRNAGVMLLAEIKT